MAITKEKVHIIKGPDFPECRDIFRFTSSFKIQNLHIPAPYGSQVYYHLDLMPAVNCDSLNRCIGESSFASKIKYLNEKQYEEVFWDKRSSEIVGKLIHLTFAIPGRWYKRDIDSHSHKIAGLEKRTFCSPEFEVDETPLSIIRVEPECRTIHSAPESFGQAHYYLTAVSKGQADFEVLKHILHRQRGEYDRDDLKRDYPKEHLPLELRGFNFLA